MDVTSRLKDIFIQHKIKFKVLEHDEAPTCEIAAKLRGTELSLGLKTLLMKGKTEYFLCSLRANKELDSKKLRKIINSNKLRFASDEEFLRLTHVKKGALPPFGQEVFGLELYLDDSIYDRPEIVFTAGVLNQSIVIKTSDYLKMISAHLCSFKRD